jgi:protein-tyrosine kinase
MSRNFELLQQLEKEHQVFRAPAHARATGNGGRPHLDLDAFNHEESMKLVQRLFLSAGSDAPRIVVFCAVETGDGASWTCTHAGEALTSQVESSVCLVDANLRTPFLHEYFRGDTVHGLTEAILQTGPIRDFAYQVNGGNLWLLPCGSNSSDPHGLVNSERLRSRMAELKTEFDFVLIDGPPVNLYADASLLGKLADGVVLIVQANSTRREAAKKAKESLESSNVRVFGTVLNKRLFPIPESLYRRV